MQDLHHFLIAFADMVEDAEEALRWIQVVVLQSYAILLFYHLEASKKLPDALFTYLADVLILYRHRIIHQALADVCELGNLSLVLFDVLVTTFQFAKLGGDFGV